MGDAVSAGSVVLQSRWTNVSDVLTALLDFVGSGGIDIAASQGGNDPSDLTERLLIALRPLVYKWAAMKLSLSLHCCPVFDAPLGVLLKVLSDPSEKIASVAASMASSMLQGVDAWVATHALGDHSRSDELECRRVREISLRVLHVILGVLPQHAEEANSPPEAMSSLLQMVIRFLILTPGGEAYNASALFANPPPLAQHSASATSMTDEDMTLVEDVALSIQQSWLQLSSSDLFLVVAPLRTDWLAAVNFCTITNANSQHEALADELRTSYKAHEKRLYLELEAVRLEERQGWEDTRSQVSSFVEPRLNYEKIRWSDAAAAVEERRRLGERRLRKELRWIRSNRGPMGAGEFGDDGAAYWKLDLTEDHARRRRLRRNLAFDSHEEASVEGRADAEHASLYALTTCIAADASRSPHNDDADASGHSPSLSAACEGSTSSRKRNSLASRLLGQRPVVNAAAERAHFQVAAARLASTEADTEPLIFAMRASIVNQLRVIPGLLVLTKVALHFLPTSEQLLEGARDTRWELRRLSEVLSRRYLLQLRALEIFFGTGGSFSSVLIAFDGTKERHDAQKAVLSQQLPGLLPHHSRKPDGANGKLRPDPSTWTRQWQMGALSNFEYLMRLNSLAGRTYSDLTQYPVMPWVLADYTSTSINLDEPKHYRNLSRPIGALNDANHEKLDLAYDALLTTYNEVGDGQIAPPPFHYGSHYSSMGVVLFFLIRLEPFTTQQIELQGGRFDHADRLFHSIPETWAHLVEAGNTSDVKELIPEAYYMPEFLLNANDFNLGNRQTGERLHDVVLPPWAKDPRMSLCA